MESLILVIHLKRLLNVIKEWDTAWMLKILFMRLGNSTLTLQMGQQILQAIISVCLCNAIINKEFYQLALGFYWQYDICLSSSIYTLWRLYVVLFSIRRVSIRRSRILSFTFLFSETMCLTHLTGKGLQEDKNSALCRPKKLLWREYFQSDTIKCGATFPICWPLIGWGFQTKF